MQRGEGTVKIDSGIEYDLDNFDCKCNKDGRRIAVGGHAKSHMITEKISPLTLCDMIQNPVPCNKTVGKPHRSSSRRLCAMRKNRNHKMVKYNIVFDPFTIKGEQCWVVAHLEPL